jgi:hypothetical protein
VLICGSPEDTHVHVSAKEKFEDTKSVKDMHYDGQNKKDQILFHNKGLYLRLKIKVMFSSSLLSIVL